MLTQPPTCHPPTQTPGTVVSETSSTLSCDYSLLMTRFWPKFKDRFLGTSWADFNCYGDICSGNICPGDICPYQEYLLGPSLIPNVTVTFVQAIFVLTTFFHIMNSSVVPDPILTQFCVGLNLSGPKFFLIQNFFRPKIFGTQYFFWPKLFRPKFFWPEIFLTQHWEPIFFGSKIFRT